MGASYNEMAVSTDDEKETVRANFKDLCDTDRYENGHSYSGGFGMVHGLKFHHTPFFSREEASEFLSDQSGKDKALAIEVPDENIWVIGAWCSS